MKQNPTPPHVPRPPFPFPRRLSSPLVASPTYHGRRQALKDRDVAQAREVGLCGPIFGRGEALVGHTMG